MANKKVEQKAIPQGYVRHPRRVLDSKDYCTPECSLSIRTLINRSAQGLPINAKISQHVPLPPDGEDLNDFETGTEEILDVTDAVEHIEKLNADIKHIREQQRKAQEEALKVTNDAPPVTE